MTERLKVLILGGYGTFGGRLARLLADERRLMLIIAGRSLAKAEAFCGQFRSQCAEIVPLTFDREGDVEWQLRDASPDIVVDASGPFQAYGDPYRVVKACLALGVDYLDLADGSDFVKGIAQFDVQATTCARFVLAGVSSFPVLTAAAVRRLSIGMARIDAVTGGIAPSPYAGVGLNVIRAIASYAGKLFELRDGRHYGLVETRRFTIAPPGRLPLRSTRFSLVDVPDLKVLPGLWPSLKSVWMGAGPVPEILHRALNGLAWLVRFKILPSLSPFATLMYHVVNVLTWGEHRGGMFVEVEGTDMNGERLRRSWHMIAEGDDGPFIPSMAAEAIIRHCLEGKRPASGARPATNELDLADYDALFARRRIYAGVREPLPNTMPLYRRILGEAWSALPAPLRAMHDLKGELVAEGRATVDRGKSLLARLVATLFRFPKVGRDVPVKVSFKSQNGREVWYRNFAGRAFQSTQEEGRGRFERLLCERFGPFAFGLALVPDGDRMQLVVRRWSAFGVPLPVALAPCGETYESGENGRFHFHVEIGHRLVGLIVRYRGWLTPSEGADAQAGGMRSPLNRDPRRNALSGVEQRIQSAEIRQKFQLHKWSQFYSDWRANFPSCGIKRRT